MAADREPKSPEPAAEPKSTEPAAWTPKSVAELLAITSLFAYGVTYLACVLFYGPLGAEPSDVGLGYAEILAQAAVFLVILLTPPVVAAVFLVTRRPGGVNDARRLLTTWGAVRVLAALILVAAGYMGLLAVGGANSVKKGERPFDFLGLLPWSDTEVASVEWTARPPSGTAPLPSLPRCVIRVGESSATERLYDSSAETLSRLPQAMVKVTARPSRDKC